MALTINTNLSSLIVQSNLNAATNTLSKTIERMTTGYKINHAKDNAAGYSIATNWTTQLGSLDIASQNASMGLDMLTTAEENYSLLTSHLQRVRDLTEQSANGTYGSESLKAINAEIIARLDEIDRISHNAEFNGIALMTDGAVDITLQVGINSNSDSQITLSADLFQKADVEALFSKSVEEVAEACSTGATAASQLDEIDKAINNISARVTALGSAQNRIESATEAIAVQTQNLTSSLSTIKDSDVANESSNYIRAQILQQASATLLSTANQAPSIALNLI